MCSRNQVCVASARQAAQLPAVGRQQRVHGSCRCQHHWLATMQHYKACGPGQGEGVKQGCEQTRSVHSSERRQ